MGICSTFGKKIKEIRTSLNISQESLSEKTGLHRTYISSVERGQRNISLLNIEKIANALNVEVLNCLLFKNRLE